MRGALQIAAKDLRQRLRDRSALMVALVVPLVLASIFGLTLRDVGSGDVTFDFALVDRDGGTAARRFALTLRAIERQDFVRVRPASLAEGRRLVDEGAVSAAFVVAPGFSRAVEAGRRAELRVLGDPDAEFGTLVARSIAERYAAGLTSIRVAVAAGGNRPELAGLVAALPPSVGIADVTTTRKELDLTTFYAAGMAVFFLFFTVQFGISSLLVERRERTLARLLVAPLPRSSILAGKLITSVVLGAASTAVLAVATRFLLGAEWGDPVGVGILILAGVLAATAVMALVATVAKTAEQASSWQAIVALVLGMLGGAFFPVAQAGGLIELLSRLTPHAWFLEGLAELAGGAGPAAVLPAAGAILAFAAVTGTLAFLRIGKLVEP